MAKKVKTPPVSSSPYEKDEGYTASRRNKLTGDWNVLYKTDDDENGCWDTLCVAHGTLVTSRLKRKATSMLLHPTEWCQQCKNDEETEEAKRILEIRHVERPYSEQIKMLANLAKGNPAKCLMFEQLHGTKPDQFWD